MKNFAVLALIALGLIFNVSYLNAAEKQSMNDAQMKAEMAAIVKALDMYAGAAIKGSSKVAEPAFAPLATMSFTENGKLVTVPIKALYEYFDKTGPHPASYEITSAKIEGDVATVSIDSKFGDTKFNDMFTLVKDGNDWKIVSKVYHIVK